MNTEEPAWEAELKKEIHRYFDEIEGGSIWYLTGRMMETLAPHIQAAEERGRREALKEHIKGLKADWARFRGRVLQEAWEAMRDAEDGPLTDAMGVINDLLEKK